MSWLIELIRVGGGMDKKLEAPFLQVTVSTHSLYLELEKKMRVMRTVVNWMEENPESDVCAVTLRVSRSARTLWEK